MRRLNQSGQGMVEFVIILIFIMAMCAGMIASIRLLTLQFWAQQEARYIAFEQTWASHDFYAANGGNPIDKLNQGGPLGRPQSVSDRTSTRNVSDDQDLRELLSWAVPFATEESPLAKPIRDLENGPVVLASARAGLARMLKGKTSDWLREKDEGLFSPDSAFASQEFERVVRAEGVTPDLFPMDDLDIADGTNTENLRDKILVFMKTAQVGPKVCEAWREAAPANPAGAALLRSLGEDCAGRVEQGLSEEIAENADIPQFVRTYEQTIQSGFSAGEALETNVREEVATHFYSFFDGLVRAARIPAPAALILGRTDAFVLAGDPDIGLAKFRYLGSNIALIQIFASLGSIAVSSPFDRSAAAALALDQQVTGILHADVDGAQFFLNPIFLPIPPLFGAAGPGLQTAIMKNIMSQSEDDPIRDEQIDNANKLVEVSYSSAGSMFRLAKNEIRGSESANLGARFYLVTQDWHLARRQDRTGPYREKGTQFDTKSDESEEAVLRRRVLGLWLIPSNIPALVEPISFIPGLGFLQPVFQVLEPISSIISIVKGFVTDNPLFDIAQALSEIPVIGNLVPVPPIWPAVRPDAYPKSVEMTGNDPADPDKLMNEERNFQKYVDEQRSNDPDPNPDFGDSE